MTIGERITVTRAAAGISRQALAWRIETSYMNLWRIETGRQQPTLETLNKLAAALNVQPGDLLRTETPNGAKS